MKHRRGEKTLRKDHQLGPESSWPATSSPEREHPTKRTLRERRHRIGIAERHPSRRQNTPAEEIAPPLHQCPSERSQTPDYTPELTVPEAAPRARNLPLPLPPGPLPPGRTGAVRWPRLTDHEPRGSHLMTGPVCTTATNGRKPRTQYDLRPHAEAARPHSFIHQFLSVESGLLSHARETAPTLHPHRPRGARPGREPNNTNRQNRRTQSDQPQPGRRTAKSGRGFADHPA